MAWGWSHTQEAYRNAEDNLRALDLDTLQVIAAEWESVRPDEDEWSEPHFSLWHYRRALARIKREDMSADDLADIVWNRAEDQVTCDNGGFNAWMCPFGCGPHCVSFDSDTDTEGDN